MPLPNRIDVTLRGASRSFSAPRPLLFQSKFAFHFLTQLCRLILQHLNNHANAGNDGIDLANKPFINFAAASRDRVLPFNRLPDAQPLRLLPSPSLRFLRFLHALQSLRLKPVGGAGFKFFK